MHLSAMGIAQLALLLLFVLIVPRAAPQSTEGSISGVVVVADTGSPIPEAQVVLRRTMGSSSDNLLTTSTDVSGRFTFDKLTPDLYSVRVAASGYRQLGVAFTGWMSIGLVAGEVMDLRIE